MKLNLGSGDCPLEGWENLDAKHGHRLYPISYNGLGTPLGDDSADEIRASHVLEHFPHHQTLDVLKEWVRVLKPGGWLKIAVPDFDWIVRQYVDGGAVIRPDEFPLQNSLVTLLEELPGGRAMIAPLEGYLMGGHVDEHDGHKALFTHKKLYGLLNAAGLVNIQPWTSEIADCASLPVSLNLMGQKPEAPGGRNDLTKCQSWDYSGDPLDPRSRAIQCPLPVVGGKFCAKHAEPKPEQKSEWVAAGHDCRPAPKASTSRTQVFAAGRWQDLSGEVQCATQEELEAAQRGELQTRTIVLDEKRNARIALCLSTPRVGFLRPLERLLGLAHQCGISLFSGDGVFWHHSLSRSIKNACEFYFEDSGDGFDFILTADYDTYALPEDIQAMASLLARSPEVDCIVPLQMKRGGTGEILVGGENMNLTAPLVPIQTGHFGFTLFRASFFERLPTPWFYEKPDAEGHWGEGRIDADIGFWLNAKKAKLQVMLAPQIVVGHGEELVVYPRITGGRPEKAYQAVNDWLNLRKKPEGVGVR